MSGYRMLWGAVILLGAAFFLASAFLSSGGSDVGPGVSRGSGAPATAPAFREPAPRLRA